MVKHTFVALAALTLVGLASPAFAQQARYSGPVYRQADSLDPLARAVRTPTRSVTGTQVAPASRLMNLEYTAYLRQYERYLAEQARQAAYERSKPSGWMTAMQGIGAGLQLADRALDVYEHAIEANALADYYRD